MGKLTFQKLNLEKAPEGDPIEVQFNPTEYAFEKAASYADVAIPGLDAPILQFVRGEAETLSLELFFDSTESGTGDEADSVTAQVDPFYRLVKISGDLHTPPIVRITWSEGFPGLAADGAAQPRPSFDCVVTSVGRRYTLFNPNGLPLRATVTLSLREYRTLREQLEELNLQSSDHTRVHVVREGETLPHIAFSAYQDPTRWRLIADANRILNPRRITPGQALILPPTA